MKHCAKCGRPMIEYKSNGGDYWVCVSCGHREEKRNVPQPVAVGPSEVKA